MSPKKALEVPGHLLRGAPVNQGSTEATLWLLDHLCAQVGLPDLAEADVLDMGCGVKFTQVILSQDVPVRRYVGVDVYRELIEFLQQHVDDARFDHLHVDLHNDRYNPDGVRLAALDRLPLPAESFDVICLYSVFTHLDPEDYREMLRLLRPLVRPTGRLMYSLYIDEETDGGHGYVDSVARMVRASPGLLDRPAEGDAVHADFRDVDPQHPLLIALYSRDHALGLVEGTGWKVERVDDPGPYIQHSIVCSPV